ncbi:MAG: hypothetical protein AAB873_02535, partial [Patescibacteria group bacterium]
MSSKSGYSSKILKILAEKPALSLEAVKENSNKKDKREEYSLNRSVKSLTEAGCVEIIRSEHKDYLRLTKKGKNRLNSLRIGDTDALVPQTWDGFWRIVILDLPEDRKNERESLRYLLKKANFVCVKNTVWISPHPYEHLFTNIKKDLGLS